MKTTKAFIINFNRLTYLRDMVEWCQAHGLEPIVVDNASDYPPLLEYYADHPCEIIRMPKNYGHVVMWHELFPLPKERFIITDPDLDMSGVPDDFLAMMNKGLDRHYVPKCGLSLEIADLPDNDEGAFIRKIEGVFWDNPLDDLFFDAKVDTTFSLYREGMNYYTIEGIRTNRPYTARHYSWYYTDFNSLPEDEKNYYRTANDSASGKKRLMK
jgi:hypothetical protein